MKKILLFLIVLLVLLLVLHTHAPEVLPKRHTTGYTETILCDISATEDGLNIKFF